MTRGSAVWTPQSAPRPLLFHEKKQLDQKGGVKSRRNLKCIQKLCKQSTLNCTKKIAKNVMNLLSFTSFLEFSKLKLSKLVSEGFQKLILNSLVSEGFPKLKLLSLVFVFRGF